LDPTTPGTSGQITADTTGITGDTTGTITVGNIAKVLIISAAGGAGNEVGDLTITADDTLTLFAAGYDAGNNFIGDVVVDWTSSGTLTPTINSQGVNSVTFSPTTAPASGKIFANHATAADDSTGTITVNPGVPVGTVTLIPTPPTLPADGFSTSQITSSLIVDSDNNAVGANRQFTVVLSDTNLGMITTADVDPGRAGHQIATNSNSELVFEFKADTLGGTVNIFVSSVNGSATGNAFINIGSLSISSIATFPDFVSQGQSGISVQMVVQNLSPSTITNLTASLTFTGTVDRTGEFTQQRTDSFTSIQPQGQRTLTFDVAVDQSASLELITIDGQVSGEIGGTPVNEQGALTPDSWAVQIPAELSATSVSSPFDTVVVGQQGNSVTVRIANPAGVGAATAVIDNIQLKFLKDGVIDKTSDFPFSPDGGNPASIPGGQELEFNFTVGVGATADTGNYVIDVEVSGHDTNFTNLTLQDLNATTTHDWYVKTAPTLQILSLTSTPTNTFIAGQTDNWTVRMEVRNNGQDPINLSFDSDTTYIKFIIGVDLTSEYTIIQPSQLVVAGTNRLNGGTTDTLDFVIDVTGTTPGTALITGSVGGTDVITGNPILDNTDDGGTGVVNIISQSATVFIAQTNPVTFNISLGVGIVNTSQSFEIMVNVKNDLQEPVENVEVELSSNTGLSNIVQSPLTIPLIAANGTGTANFDITASSTPNATGEMFTAEILSATGQQSQTPAQIGTPLDDNAIFRIQTPASLRVQFTQLEPFQTAGDTFQVQAQVVNLGQAEVDNSGQLRLNNPINYTLLSGSPAVQSFSIDNIVQWQVKAPDTATVLDTFIVEILQSPLEFNTNSLAAVETSADSQKVQTLDIGLVIQDFSIINPAGATDNTLSTEQRFELQASISVSENIDSVRADLSLPQDYELAPGFNSSRLLTSGQENVLWEVDVSDQAHQIPRTFEVRMRGYDEGEVRADTTAELDVVAVVKAIMDFDNFRVSNPSGADKVSLGQEFQLSALVNNVGQAGVEGTAELTLDLANTGIISQETFSQTFVPNVPVIWNVTAPNTPTPSQSISVTLSTIPFDENTNNTASHNPQQLVRTLSIETVDVGSVTINNVFVSSPTGAQDSVISTEQEFFIDAEIEWNDLVQLQAEIEFPLNTDYVVLDQDGSRFRNITQGPSTTVRWILKAPSISLSEHYIKINTMGRDASNTEVEIVAEPDSLPFTVVEKAHLNFGASITDPPSAIDKIVTVGQLFTVTAVLQNNGQAALIGEDSLRITLPSGYTTSEPLVKSIMPEGQITWQIKAPDDPTTILDIVVEVIDRNAVDENTNQLPPLTPTPPEIVIPVQTQAIGLNLSLLNDRKPTTIVRGATDVPIFGLKFANTSDADIVIENINMNVNDKEGNSISPNSVITRLTVVDYFNTSVIFRELVSLPETNPMVLDFSPAISILPSQSQSIEFRVDIASQTETNNFRLSIDSPQDDILAKDVGSDSLVTIRDDSSGLTIVNVLTPGFSVLIDPNLEASFFNFPNPFGQNSRDITKFNYNLTQDSDITIRIYTLLGELVWSISHSASDPEGRVGTHDGKQQPTIVWDGTNDKGQKVLNGVYVAVLTTNDGKALTKIALAK
ncbi:MAG: hypothetical protein ACE5JB_00600, partial [bacterium]